MEKTVAEILFDSMIAKRKVKALLEEDNIDFERIGWDDYDGSLEVYGVPGDTRLSDSAVCKLLDLFGFTKIYVNHDDEWETHYGPGNRDGWRVSYPHKRTENQGSIWVERDVPTWPREWFESGKVEIVK